MYPDSWSNDLAGRLEVGRKKFGRLETKTAGKEA